MKAIMICAVVRKTLTDRDEEKKYVKLYFIRHFIGFYRYLRLYVKLPREKIFPFYKKKLVRFKAMGILNGIERIVNKSRYEPLLIYFRGHGRKDRWGLYSKNNFFPEKFILCHHEIIKALENQRGPLIVIADTCHAMAFKSLQKLKCEKLLLGLAPENRRGRGTVLPQIISSWLKRKPANPKYDNGHGGGRIMVRHIVTKKGKKKIILRRGDDLDYLLFPKE